MQLIDKKNFKKRSGKKTPSKKKADLSSIAEKAINFGVSDLARNFDKYFEKSLK